MKSIFLSSTFRDMEIERDNLMIEVLPELDNYAKNYGETFHFLDLRWGVNTEDLAEIEKDEKVISVCLDAIDLTNPYMIVFIGERYGWVPPKERLLRVAREKDYEISDYAQSITNLEIEYGALSGKAKLDKCLFYFRKELDVPKEFEKYYKETNSESTKKLNALKQYIINAGAFVREYKCEWDYDKNCQKLPENFSENLTSDIKRIFDKEMQISKELSWQQRAFNIHKAYYGKNKEIFAARENIVEECKELLLEKPYRVFYLKGEEGCGKSVLLSKLEEELGKTCDTMYFACGNSKFSKTGELVIRQIVFKFEELLGAVHEDTLSEDEFERPTTLCEGDRLEKLIKRHAQMYGMNSKKRMFIFCDETQYSAVEKNNYWHVASNLLSYIPDVLHENVTFVVAVRPDFKVYKSTTKYGKYSNELKYEFNDYTYNLGALSLQDKYALVKKFETYNSKQLPQRVIDKTVNKKSTDNALYLSILLQRLMMINHDDFTKVDKFGQGIEGINKFLENIIDTAPADINTLSLNLINKAIERINETLCSEVVYLVAAAKNGANERELEAICKNNGKTWDVADFHGLLKYMNSFFIYSHNSRIQFKSEALKNHLGSTKDLSPYYKKILQYINDLPESETRQKVDAAYYLYKLGDEKTLVKLLSSKSANTLTTEFEAETHMRQTGAIEELCIIATYDKNWVVNFFNNAIHNGATLDFAYNIVRNFYNFFMLTPTLQQSVHVEIAHAYHKMVDDLCEKTIKSSHVKLPEKYSNFRKVSIDKEYLRKLRNLIKIYEKLESNFLAGFILLENERVYTVQIDKQILKIRKIIAGIKKDKRSKKDVYLAYSGLYTAYDMQKDRENALQALLDGLKILDDIAAKNPKIYVETAIYRYIADEYAEQKKYDKAHEFFCMQYEEERKATAASGEYSQEEIDSGRAFLYSQHHFAKSCILCKKYDMALIEIEEALKMVDDMTQNSSGNKHGIENYTYYEYFGELLMKDELKQYDRALECFEKHELALKKHCPQEDLGINIFSNLNNICELHEKKGNIAKAIEVNLRTIGTMRVLIEETRDEYLYDKLCESYEKLIGRYKRNNEAEKAQNIQKEFDEFVKDAEQTYLF